MFRQAVLFFCLFVVVTEARRKFAGQLTGNLTSSRIFPTNTEITQFQANGTLKRFTHENGRLIVTRSGYYYIYAQAFFQNYTAANFFHNRVALTLNGYDVSLMQTALSGGFSDFGSKFTGAIKFLNEGDYIGLRTVYPCALWVTGRHTFFGAYRI
ncbi:tumor necrosis factor ligand superfamily member 11-like [Orbicella faveolata]|uniref:tumor necrosis factor ligand superfamily member 11-like n=1 Tax=Orbicella faveolata TaxID=48498 RepID=UPI0009E1FE80|nr:tumor necrosis factor ligand superfamily member 11-like [Orbicella faveolata]XP_020618284.1 tumor necrosis factor ligand superfamily member 11-like [Orbicella faveolata]